MKKAKIFIFIPALLFLVFSCNRQPDQGSKKVKFEFSPPEDHGMKSDSLYQIDSLFQHYVDQGWMPCAVALLARDGKIVYETSVGFSDVEEERTLGGEDIFRLASMTKPLISTAIMQLAEKGKLKLSDELSLYIPEFSAPRVLVSFNAADTSWEDRPALREITIHDLLTHTSGISYGFMDPKMAAIYGSRQIPDLSTPLDYTLKDKIALLGKLPLVHDPGEQHTYGLSSDVLGRVIELVSGLSLEQYIHTHITGPLGMNSTYFFLPEDMYSRLVTAYVAGADSIIIPIGELGGDLYHPDYPKSGAKSYYSGGSGLNSSIRDYYLFLQAMLDGARGRSNGILTDSSVSVMVSDQMQGIPYWPGKAIGYGFEILTEANENMGQLPGRFSWFGAFQTFFYVDTERDLIAIMMSQVMFSPLVFDVFADFERIINSSMAESNH